MPQARQTSEDSSSVLAELLGDLLTKTYYGHTLGELLSLSVALERAVEDYLAFELTESEHARLELRELVLHEIGRSRTLSVLGKVVTRREDESIARQLCDSIRAVYKLRDQFAHSALGKQPLGTDGWLLEAQSPKSGSESIAIEHVDSVLANGRQVLFALRQHKGGD